MKRLSIFLLFVAIFAGSNLNANNAAKIKAQAVKNINGEFRAMYKNMPFADIMGEETNCSVELFFKVDNLGKVEVYHVSGKNQRMVDYSKKLFNTKNIQADSILFSDNYRVKLMFEYHK